MRIAPFLFNVPNPSWSLQTIRHFCRAEQAQYFFSEFFSIGLISINIFSISTFFLSILGKEVGRLGFALSFPKPLPLTLTHWRKEKIKDSKNFELATLRQQNFLNESSIFSIKSRPERFPLVLRNVESSYVGAGLSSPIHHQKMFILGCVYKFLFIVNAE